jgi:hypothetical protein
LHLEGFAAEAGSSAAVVVVVTAATEAAEETVRTGEDYLVVHSKLH